MLASEQTAVIYSNQSSNMELNKNIKQIFLLMSGFSETEAAMIPMQAMLVVVFFLRLIESKHT